MVNWKCDSKYDFEKKQNLRCYLEFENPLQEPKRVGLLKSNSMMKSCNDKKDSKIILSQGFC